jgi:glycosyltransferase involved in cell wall biosynthesis
MTKTLQKVRFRILTDHGNPENFAPYRIRVKLSAPLFQARLFRLPLFRIAPILILGFKCWWISIRHRGLAAFVTIGSAHGFVFAFLQYLTRPFIRPRTHVMFDFLLERKRIGILKLFDSLKMCVFCRVVDRAIVWGLPDVKSYSREYGIPREKLTFIPFHVTLEQYTFDIRNNEYIFAGGDNGRDYRTLIDAVKTIDYPVFIATRIPDIAEMAAQYPHITVQPVSHEEFRRKMAGCSIFVEAHPKDFFRTAGHQTFLNAMWMGKPVILADKKSALGYIEDGVDGLVVAAGDAHGINTRIRQILADPALAAIIGEAARVKTHQPHYRTLNCMQAIYNIALGIEMEKQGTAVSGDCIKLY